MSHKRLKVSERYQNDKNSKLDVSSSASEAVESPSLPLESVDNVHGSDSLPLGVLGVGHGVTDDVLQEHLQEKL